MSVTIKEAVEAYVLSKKKVLKNRSGNSNKPINRC